MADTVVGIFDEYNEALQARARLVGIGIHAEALEISPRRGGEEGAKRDAPPDHRGFFARLFGLGRDEEETGHYAEAVRRGSVALTVSLEDDARVDEVSHILNECGAIDVDERVERWKAAGYTGFDPSAPIYTDKDVERERKTFGLGDAEDETHYRGPERRVGSTQRYTGPERRMTPW
jgi:hypothetical protein